MKRQLDLDRRHALQMLFIAGSVSSKVVVSGRISEAMAQGVTASHADLALRIKAEALQFLATLDPAKARRCSFPFSGAERTRWHWTVPSSVPRNGLMLGELDASQYRAAMALMAASLSSRGFDKVQDIMRLQTVLPTGAADPLAYYVSIFGDPTVARWGWRLEGHHLSHHFSIVDGQVSMTPFFHGAWPTTTRSGFRAMPREEDAARELVLSLSPALRKSAIFQENALSRHVTQNNVSVNALWSFALSAEKTGNSGVTTALGIVVASMPIAPLRASILEKTMSPG